MSKIQEALSKLRLDRGPMESGPGGSADAASPFATIKSSDVFAEESGTEYANEIVVSIDQEKLRDAGLLAPDYHEHLLADQYRDIKRPLIANAYGRRVTKVENGKMIMVASALKAEGKSFTTVNLAISIAQEQDISVLLVDADVRKPHVSHVFGVSDRPGLLNLLDGRPQNPETMVIPTSMSGLSVLPAGQMRSDATELLSSARMEALVRELARRFPNRIVLFDTSPLLQTTEAKALIHLVGQTVLVIKADSTPQGAIEEALRFFGEDDVVNLVLNQARAQSKKERYGSGYGYGYGYGYGQELESKD